MGLLEYLLNKKKERDERALKKEMRKILNSYLPESNELENVNPKGRKKLKRKAFKLLENKSFTEFIKEQSGKVGVLFDNAMFSEDCKHYIKLSSEIELLLDGKLTINSIDVDDSCFELKTNIEGLMQFLDDPKTLGLIGRHESKQLFFFKAINDILAAGNYNERLIIYYDEFEGDIHRIALIDKAISHSLYMHFKESDPYKYKKYIIDGVRVLGIGIADEDFTNYTELVILP
ncbi:hypothetical protein [Carboxylicivirga taeanensis]|uniref:hypothetical protein n=1 Tax=Carboxylicivirga taeanensis TaxID=1416875 RepID=UPI003F6E14A4